MDISNEMIEHMLEKTQVYYWLPSLLMNIFNEIEHMLEVEHSYIIGYPPSWIYSMR